MASIKKYDRRMNAFFEQMKQDELPNKLRTFLDSECSLPLP